MRAIRFHGELDIRLDEVQIRTAGPGEVVVGVAACGVCGSDLHILDGSARTAHAPMTLGHEIAGTVTESYDDAWSPGDAVVVAAGVSCLECGRCREGRPNLCDRVLMTGIDFDGGWADQVVVPSRALIKRPHDLDPAIAGVAADAGATALHAVARRGAVTSGMAVAIIGIGGLGSFALQIAKRLGAAPVVAVDRSPHALDLARTLGADVVVDASNTESVGREVKLVTEGGVDVAAEFVGAASTVDTAVKSLRRGGVAVATGIGLAPLTTIPPTLWAMSEYELRGSFGSLPGDTEQVLEWLQDGSIVPPPLEPVAMDAAPESIRTALGDESRQARLVVIP